mmetsp:Transcript_6266/g.5875  ORF Transcript_6266/g.5875 Transcript_6266/m.5875 type:complete len:99 (+) Transcript_6266:44-340(+)|eukprot:CAMPEP_0197826576 /NCGR_PEP_ID=MMETSP1437-20131217/3518_1 /TAXON_ID=49252 ORGANISM="Eucampia antarctica, Strain CCMP1452" /NCGR_SAMPLE_ID=MMETSP1437 /ASSEMBLY_ACC=CAM_ASM_001096 /LENGTH=98 /DNA_ID=CAMNT_0043427073 /DNA_START=44 /DNA_END=340 /DNA_ORIENTATION=+
MSRGDKRDRDRAKNQAKLAKKNLSTKEGSLGQRNDSDSAALAAKVAKKKEMLKEQEEASANAAAVSAPIVRKKVPKKADAGLDDLLNAGMAGRKGKKK